MMTNITKIGRFTILLYIRFYLYYGILHFYIVGHISRRKMKRLYDNSMFKSILLDFTIKMNTYIKLNT
jgi:hypothetical protein